MIFHPLFQYPDGPSGYLWAMLKPGGWNVFQVSQEDDMVQELHHLSLLCSGNQLERWNLSGAVETPTSACIGCCHASSSFTGYALCWSLWKALSMLVDMIYIYVSSIHPFLVILNLIVLSCSFISLVVNIIKNQLIHNSNFIITLLRNTYCVIQFSLM